MKKTPIKTSQQIRKEFRKNGKTFADFARSHGFKRETVMAVLEGRIKGHYGISHKIAVELGLKRKP